MSCKFDETPAGKLLLEVGLPTRYYNVLARNYLTRYNYKFDGERSTLFAIATGRLTIPRIGDLGRAELRRVLKIQPTAGFEKYDELRKILKG